MGGSRSRNRKFTRALAEILESSVATFKRTTIQCPNLQAHVEGVIQPLNLLYRSVLALPGLQVEFRSHDRFVSLIAQQPAVCTGNDGIHFLQQLLPGHTSYHAVWPS